MKKFLESVRAKAELVAKGDYRKAMRNQDGYVDISAIMMMGIGMVFLAVGFIIFPIVTTATTALLNYQYSANASITDATFTGFTSVVGVTPLLVLIGFVVAAVIEMWMGVKIARGQAGSAHIDMGGTIMLGISMIFIAIGLIIMPVVLDGIASVLHGGGSGISASYTGLQSILEVTPIIVLIAFIAGAVLTGYFGMKKLGARG